MKKSKKTQAFPPNPVKFHRVTQEQLYFPGELNLSRKQAIFAMQYAIHGEGVRAASEAGYSKRSLRSIADENLRKPHILKAIQYAQGKMRLVVTPERIVEEWARIAFLDPADLYNDDGTMKEIQAMSEDSRHAIGRLRTKSCGDSKEIDCTVISKVQALEALTKILGLYARDNEQKQPEGDKTAVFIDPDMQELLDQVLSIGMKEEYTKK